jgi:hypothetical protein
MAGPKKPKDGISKMEAMRQTLAKLSKDAPLADVLKALKQDFGITMSTGMAYTYRSAANKKKKGTKPGPKPAVPVAAAAVPSTNGHANGSISLEDITAVKALADKLGAEKVWQLAKVLAK